MFSPGGILASLAGAFFKAFGDSVLAWLGQKRAEEAQRDLGASEEREKIKDGTMDVQRQQLEAAKDAPKTLDDLDKRLESGGPL